MRVERCFRGKSTLCKQRSTFLCCLIERPIDEWARRKWGSWSWKNWVKFPQPAKKTDSTRYEMSALRFKTCRLLSGNVRNRELTIIQRRILQRLRKKERSRHWLRAAVSALARVLYHYSKRKYEHKSVVTLRLSRYCV